MWLYGQVPLMVSHHPAQFGGNRQCGVVEIWVFLQIWKYYRKCWKFVTVYARSLSPLLFSCATRIANNNLRNNFYADVTFGGHRHCGSRGMNILANKVILRQMQDIRDCICSLTSIIIIFPWAQGMPYVTCVTINNLRNTFYATFFSVSNETSLILVTRFLGNK